jgi:hypothetical protein
MALDMASFNLQRIIQSRCSSGDREGRGDDETLPMHRQLSGLLPLGPDNSALLGKKMQSTVSYWGCPVAAFHKLGVSNLLPTGLRAW